MGGDYKKAEAPLTPITPQEYGNGPHKLVFGSNHTKPSTLSVLNSLARGFKCMAWHINVSCGTPGCQRDLARHSSNTRRLRSRAVQVSGVDKKLTGTRFMVLTLALHPHIPTNTHKRPRAERDTAGVHNYSESTIITLEFRLSTIIMCPQLLKALG